MPQVLLVVAPASPKALTYAASALLRVAQRFPRYFAGVSRSSELVVRVSNEEEVEKALLWQNQINSFGWAASCRSPPCFWADAGFSELHDTKHTSLHADAHHSAVRTEEKGVCHHEQVFHNLLVKPRRSDL